ncbi:MAG: Sua5/YciO/YrdC/YwlC family protein, partial [Thermoanaerobaculia bacterium]
RRPHKPFALMVRDLAAVERIAQVIEGARESLLCPARPIVLLPAKQGNGVAPSVAPGLSELGVMLPYTPLHHLLLASGPDLLVMTSGNLSEEPIARENAEALEKLSSVADAFLLHDREIHTRADDSVVRIVAGRTQPVRRSRGFVPEAISLGFSAPSVLAVGGELKNTVCLTRQGEAFLSPHVGDLDNLEAFGFFEEVIEKLSRLLSARPEAVAHDLHPDYRSTRWALSSGLPREPVQHHHAHIASCLAEHGQTGPVIGVAFDGTGCGPAGDLWGGEILLADLSGFRRLGHLRPIALAGGEAAIREPWRLAAAALLDAGISLDCLERIETGRREAVRQLIEKRVATPLATGAGRWFDAVSSLCGVRDEITYEGQAAVELEAVAAPGDLGCHSFEIGPSGDGPFEVDLRPAVREIAAEICCGIPAPAVSARFHRTLAAAILEACRRGREESDVGTVALSGGCFQNKLLTERARELLEREGFEVLIHSKVPPNDGGLALGQAAVA